MAKRKEGLAASSVSATERETDARAQEERVLRSRRPFCSLPEAEALSAYHRRHRPHAISSVSGDGPSECAVASTTYGFLTRRQWIPKGYERQCRAVFTRPINGLLLRDCANNGVRIVDRSQRPVALAVIFC